MPYPVLARLSRCIEYTTWAIDLELAGPTVPLPTALALALAAFALPFAD